MSLISMDFTAVEERVAAAQTAGREDDLAYHQRRAEEELRIAQETEFPVVRRFHYHLAALHLDRAHSGLKKVA